MSGSLPGQAIPDLIRQGLGQAARAVGDWCDLFRPDGPSGPLAPDNRLLRMPAAFASPHGFAAPVGYGEALYLGYFDAAYVKPGDYLSGRDGVFFVASVPRLGPVLCVKTNRTLSLSRPSGPPAAGVNRYVGAQAGAALPLLTGWPASVLAASGAARGAPPGEAPGLIGGGGGWSVLLPGAAAALRPGDLAQDELARAGVVSSTELSDLGWRLHIRQAAS